MMEPRDYFQILKEVFSYDEAKEKLREYCHSYLCRLGDQRT